MSGSDRGIFDEVEIMVEEEVQMIESSCTEDVANEPPSAWLYDPLDAQLEEVRLRSLLSAVESVESGEHY